MYVPMATQGERRRQTRTALLDAAAALFAERGIADSSVDAIAEAAGRTSGALYDHFGSKEGVLFALLEGWVDDVAAVLSAELVTAPTLPERMAVLWRNISSPAVGNGRWIALEHEMWSYAVRNPIAMEHLGERYRVAWAGLGELASGDPDAAEAGPAVLAVLLGLEMMRRVDPAVVTDQVAVGALCAVATPVQLTTHSPEPTALSPRSGATTP
jgi:AcrR family transcriptional regulator